MATVARSFSVDSPDPTIADLVARAAALVPMLRERAADAEAQRRVPSDVFATVRDAELLKLMQPRRFGGFGLGPSALLAVGYELGRGCGSTAWCSMIANCSSWYGAYWPLEAQAEIWGANPDAVIASTGVPTGKSEAVEGGFNVWGRWPFASNCENSDWLVVSCAIPGPDGTPAGAGWFLVPRDAVTIDQDSWHVSGLQGTGSKTLVAETPVFVPSHRMILMSDIQAGTVPGASVADNDTADYLFFTFGAVPLAAPLLGMAQGALEWFASTMQSKVRFAPGRGAPPSLAQNPFIQERAGRAAVTIAAARSHLGAVLQAAEEQIAAGAKLDAAKRIGIRSACIHASRQAVDAINLLAESAGANASDKSIPIQRLWRDVNAAARHVGLDATGTYATAGQHLFGMDPVGMY